MNSTYISGLLQNSSNALAQNKLDTLLASIKNSNPDNKVEQTKEAFRNFEAMFISEMLRTMFNTVPVDEIFGGGTAEETFRSMLIDEYGTLIAKQGGIGVADNMQRTLLNQQLTEGSHVTLTE
ncbi:MAG TPA: chemotactic signal-response protein chel [Alphaproteobacteria bacterium]|nr:chemotactic signal-response protein chel [Alphaproteobacteria bacterium]